MHQRQSGFTLIELMVVLAIVAAISTMATMIPRETIASVRGSATEVMAELDGARVRAVSTHRWQRMVFDAHSAQLQEGNTTGMVAPTTWTFVHTLTLPSTVSIEAVTSVSQLDPTGVSPTAGAGLTTGVVFAPDGTSESRTVYIDDSRGRNPMRVVVFRVTGSVMMRAEW